MKILTSKNDNVIQAISKTITKVNGTLFKLDNREDGASIYIDSVNIDIYDVEKVPSCVETGRYIYTTTKGFEINKNYVEPINEKERINSLVQTIANLTLENKQKENLGMSLAQTVANLSVRLNKIEKEKKEGR